MQNAQDEQPAPALELAHTPTQQPLELAQLPSIITGPELAASLRVPTDMLPKLVAAGAIPAPVLSHQRTKRWSRDSVLAAIGSRT